jgi:cyclophilin family peptidyl-prolyl cis-trans isomerase
MSINRKPGRLRNPPRGRQYAYVALVIVLLVAGGSGVYLYATRPQTASTSSTSSGIASGSGSTNSTSASGSATTFANTPCSPPTTSATTSGTSNEYALICTNLGLIEVELYPQYAPKTVANFISLAQAGDYNDLVWHRIVPGFVIQTGDPNTKNGGGDRSTWGQGDSGSNVPFEGPPNNNLTNIAGSVALASTGAGVGGASQFYINLANNAELNGNYAVFGQVINGMSVVNSLASVPLVDSTSCKSASPTATACEPSDAASAYIVSITIQSTP